MIRTLAAIAALSLAAGAALAEDPAPRIAPSLAAHTAEFAPPKVYEPAPGPSIGIGIGLGGGGYGGGNYGGGGHQGRGRY